MDIKIDKIPEEKLSTIQRTHLRIAREIARGVPVTPAKLINRKRKHIHIIGAYETWERRIFIAPERLNHLNTTLDTTIHEVSHHESQRDDGTKEHIDAILRVTHRVAQQAEEKRYDSLLGEAVW